MIEKLFCKVLTLTLHYLYQNSAKKETEETAKSSLKLSLAPDPQRVDRSIFLWIELGGVVEDLQTL